MRNYLSVLTIVVLGFWPGAETVQAQPGSVAADRELIGRFHFVGTSRVGADTNAAKLNEIAALPASKELIEQTLQKLSTAPARWLRGHIGSAGDDYAPLIRPLLDDLFRNESYAEMRGPTNAVPEVLLAVHLDKARAAVWQANLSTILQAWTGVKVSEIQPEGYKGWELKKHHDPNRIRLIQAGDWLLFGWGQDDIVLQSAMLQRIKTKGRPVDPIKEGWLEAWVDFPKLAPYHPLPAPFKLPAMTMTLQGRGEFIRPQIVMQFPQPLGLVLEPWRIPTNTIHNPFISFTAARGIVSWLDKFPALKQLAGGAVPGQIFIWSMDQLPFETCIAAPVKNGTNYLAGIESGLVSALNAKLATGHIGRSQAIWTNNAIFITGFPVVTPYLRAIREPVGDFLISGLMPSPKRDKPMPPNLISQGMAQKNLVYYDWEITGLRIQQWRSIDQLYYLASKMPLNTTNSPAQKWMDAARTKLDKCATTVNATGPNELTLVRNSAVGLSGFELSLLARWLDSPGFPLDAHYDTPVVPPGFGGGTVHQR